VIYEGMEDVLRLPETYVHLYGKTETKPGRKMGHINVWQIQRRIDGKTGNGERNGKSYC
jgi:phosphoribosylaminoimidazole carboxylase (NCAIR synthetase)